jgi:ParB-like chromosome segregation protein Spo0J
MTSNHAHIHESLQHLAVAVADLNSDPKNARKHDRRNLDAIKASLEKFGFRQPIIVQKQGMIVRAGNGRLEVAKELGWSHVPALIVDESEAEAVAYAIADNRTAELAEWDFENLADALGSLDSTLLDFTGFDKEELSFLENVATVVLPHPDARAEDTASASAEVDTAQFDAGQFEHVCPRCKLGFNDA